jgi:polysaccharide pyruvyl transferase WcaK-like protein
MGDRKRRLNVLLDGAYGRANLGDNAIAYCMSQFLVQNGVDVTISCSDPGYAKNAFGVPATDSLDFTRLRTGILKDLRTFDAIVIGGGQQLQEYKIPNPFVGMFARVCHMARQSRRHQVPIVAWSVGMDWPLSSLARGMMRRYLSNQGVTLILRDEKSFERIKGLLGDKECKIFRSVDPVFMLPCVLDTQRLSRYREKYAPHGQKRLLVCVSVLPEISGALENLVEVCRDAARAGYEVWGWHSEIRPDYDMRVRAMAAWDSIPGFRWLPPDPIDTHEVAALIGSASLIIATRMHPAIIALSQCVAAFGIATNEKMQTAFDELRMPYVTFDATHSLTFSAISNLDFSPAFEKARSFARIAEEGGRLALSSIYRDIE